MALFCLPLLHDHRSLLPALYPRLLPPHPDRPQDLGIYLEFNGTRRCLRIRKPIRHDFPMLAHKLLLGRLERPDDCFQRHQDESIQLHSRRHWDCSRLDYPVPSSAYACQTADVFQEEAPDHVHVLRRFCVSPPHYRSVNILSHANGFCFSITGVSCARLHALVQFAQTSNPTCMSHPTAISLKDCLPLTRRR